MFFTVKLTNLYVLMKNSVYGSCYIFFLGFYDPYS